MKKLMLTLFVAGVAIGGFAENRIVADLSSLDTGFYFEGDTLTLPAGSYTVMGDAIATVADNVVTCKKSGFTLLDDGAAKYRICVVPHPPAGGDVFYYFSSNGNGDAWTSVTWTKVTQNTDRTIPNGANDIAVVEGGCCWAKMLVDAPISIHGYVVGIARTITSGDGWVQLETANGQTLTFCGTEEAPAFLNLTGMFTGTCRFRIGSDGKNDDNYTLGIQVAAKRMVFDFCGDSKNCGSWHRNEGQVQINSAAINIPAGHMLEFVNGSKIKTDKVTKNNSTVGGFRGEGALRMTVSFDKPELLWAAGHEFAGTFEVVTAMSVFSAWQAPADIRVVGTSVDLGKPTTLSLGDNNNNRSSNPGVNMTPADDVYISGGVFETLLANDNNGNNRWTNGVELTSFDDLSPWYNAISQTNKFKQVTIDGEATFMGQDSHNDWRPRLYLDFDKIVRVNETDTLFFRGYSFRYDRFNGADPNAQLRGKVVGKAFVDAEGFGHDATGGEDPTKVYKIIPWVTCTYNNGNYDQFNNEWAAQDVFPGVFDGVLRLANNLGNSANTSTIDAAQPSDNVIFQDKGVSLSKDVTVNSLVYGNAETQEYPAKQVFGVGRTLTITSGGLIMSRTARWMGALEYPDKSITLAHSGTVAFGARAYIWSTHGRATGTSDGKEWNSIFAKCVAPYGVVKAGIGDLVLAQDQTGIDGDIVINSGLLWLGHPGLYRQNGWAYGKWGTDHPERIIGAATDVESITIRCGGILGIPSKGYDIDGNGTIGEGETAISKNAVITLVDNAAGSSKIEIAADADQTCLKLFANGKSLPRGTYGATGSGAANIDDDHFLGTGVLQVRKDECVAGTWILVR